MALHAHYCLECNQVIGESSDDCDLPHDHPVEEVCQSCAQHRQLAADETLSGGPTRSPDEFGVPS